MDLDRRRHARSLDDLDGGDAARPLLRSLWTDLGGAADLADGVAISGPVGALPSAFDVTGLATACAGVAALAVAELAAVRSGGRPASVAVDRLGASASFRFDARVRPDGWEIPPPWDPVAGDYEAADGWIRLHTNYEHHRVAALEVLGAPADRAAVAKAVARWRVDDLEALVVGNGGAAAAMRTPEGWAAHEAGRATAGERPAVLERVGGPAAELGPIAEGSAPLAGVRVLDLTRVIAGPVATRYLAAYGADVLRIDPPGFEEVPALLPEATAGKRCAALDLATAADRARFEELVAQAHVLVGGLRPGALDGFGLGDDVLRAINPALVLVRHSAYGWAGPWAGRRGFDSLVQMSSGIAAAGAAAARTDRPTPLPAQALDHGLGHLLAAGACRALTERARHGGLGTMVRGSLIGVANALQAFPADPRRPGADLDAVPLEPGATAWGPLHRVPLAGRIEGTAPRWAVDAGPLGRHEPQFATASTGAGPRG